MQAILEFLRNLNVFMQQGSDAANWISFGGWLVALLGFALSAWSYQRHKSRDRRIELQENYLRLELESNAVFRFEAEHSLALHDYMGSTPPDYYQRLRAGEVPDEAAEESRQRLQRESIADNFYLQQLNLFEIAARFRRDGVFAPEIFGSWVIWYYDAANSWWFRDQWSSNYSDNYTDDLYNIFGPMTKLFDDVVELIGDIPSDDNDPLAKELKAIFFDHVARRFHCHIIIEWLDRKNIAKLSMIKRVLYRRNLRLQRAAWRLRNLFRDTEILHATGQRYLEKLRRSQMEASR